MAVTPVFTCGAECGVAAICTSSAGVEHWSSVTANVSAVTSGPSPMRSTRCYRYNPTAASAYLTHQFGTAIASPATMVARFYVYFATLPDGNTPIFQELAGSMGVGFYAADSTIRTTLTVNTFGSSGVSVTTGQWYRIDVKIVNAAARTCDAKVDGVDVAQITASSADSNSTGFYWGATGTCSGDFYMDDLIVCSVAGDYPIGAGKVVGLYPNADRPNGSVYPSFSNMPAHYYSALSDFGQAAGGATNMAAQESAFNSAWSYLAKPLSTQVATNFLSDRTGASNEQLVFELEDLPADATTINAVMAVAATHSASNTGNNLSLSLAGVVGGGVDAFCNLDLSESTITIPCFLRPTGPSGGQAWTKTIVNDQCIIFFSSDVNPDVYLDGFCLEVDYVPQSGGLALPRRSWKRSRELINMGGF